jgi:hypothetical protein
MCELTNGMAWARHAMCESALISPQGFVLLKEILISNAIHITRSTQHPANQESQRTDVPNMLPPPYF